MAIQRFLAVLFLHTFLFVTSVVAQLTPGVTLDFDAATDGNGNATWEAATGGGLGRNWGFTGGQATVPVADPGTPGITATYSFPSAAATVASYNGFNGGASTQDGSFEVWFKSPDLLDRHVLFETGGNGNGVALELNGNLLTFTTQTGTANRLLTGAQVSNLGDRFHQAVGTVDLTNDVINLSTDNLSAHPVARTSRTTRAATLRDWGLRAEGASQESTTLSTLGSRISMAILLSIASIKTRCFPLARFRTTTTLWPAQRRLRRRPRLS